MKKKSRKEKDFRDCWVSTAVTMESGKKEINSIIGKAHCQKTNYCDPGNTLAAPASGKTGMEG